MGVKKLSRNYRIKKTVSICDRLISYAYSRYSNYRPLFLRNTKSQYTDLNPNQLIKNEHDKNA